jgi:hypothetical protein
LHRKHIRDMFFISFLSSSRFSQPPLRHKTYFLHTHVRAPAFTPLSLTTRHHGGGLSMAEKQLQQQRRRQLNNANKQTNKKQMHTPLPFFLCSFLNSVRVPGFRPFLGFRNQLLTNCSTILGQNCTRDIKRQQ